MASPDSSTDETANGSFNPALAFSALRPIDLAVCGAIQRTRAKVYFDGAGTGTVSSVEFDVNPKPPKAQASCIAKRLSIATVPSYSTPTPPRWVGWPLPSPLSAQSEFRNVSLTIEALMIEWNNTQPVYARSYVCGHCGNKVAPERGLSGTAVDYYNGQRLDFGASLHLCVHCGMPTVFVMQDDPTEEPTQTPSPAYGDPIPNLPEKVEAIYSQARDAMRARAFTAVALLCRTLVAHIAVAKGAPMQDKNGRAPTFQFYVEWLDGQHGGQHFLPPGGAAWVDHIRELGNAAVHDLIIVEEHEAKELIDFAGHLLRIVYDFPARMAKK